MTLNWEKIDDHHKRVRVHGGWLVKAFEDVCHDKSAYGKGMMPGWDFRIAICFVPDPNHEWI